MGRKKLMPMKSVFTDMSSIQMPYWTKKIGDKKKLSPKLPCYKTFQSFFLYSNEIAIFPWLKI